MHDKCLICFLPKSLQTKYCQVKIVYFHLTHLSLDIMAAISQTTFSNAFRRMKMHESWSNFHWFHWSFFPQGPINNIPAFVQIMAWRRISEPMLNRFTDAFVQHHGGGGGGGGVNWSSWQNCHLCRNCIYECNTTSHGALCNSYSRIQLICNLSYIS